MSQPEFWKLWEVINAKQKQIVMMFFRERIYFVRNKANNHGRLEFFIKMYKSLHNILTLSLFIKTKLIAPSLDDSSSNKAPSIVH